MRTFLTVVAVFSVGLVGNLWINDWDFTKLKGIQSIEDSWPGLLVLVIIFLWYLSISPMKMDREQKDEKGVLEKTVAELEVQLTDRRDRKALRMAIAERHGQGTKFLDDWHRTATKPGRLEQLEKWTNETIQWLHDHLDEECALSFRNKANPRCEVRKFYDPSRPPPKVDQREDLAMRLALLTDFKTELSDQSVREIEQRAT